eukprot:4150247-Pleurochrysis_carterae.AAC.2
MDGLRLLGRRARHLPRRGQRRASLAAALRALVPAPTQLVLPGSPVACRECEGQVSVQRAGGQARNKQSHLRLLREQRSVEHLVRERVGTAPIRHDAHRAWKGSVCERAVAAIYTAAVSAVRVKIGAVLRRFRPIGDGALAWEERQRSCHGGA